MKYYIALGSNRGDRSKFLNQAMALLAGLGALKVFSPVYQSRAEGDTDQPDFLNQVCILNTSLRPFRLLRKLKTQESILGRNFSRHWGPREIDLDIVDWEGPEIHSAILEIPHPCMQEREFVLRPLNDVAPAYQTRTGKTIGVLLNGFKQTGSVVPFTETNNPN